MFRCQYSGEVSKSGEKPVMVVVETRSKTYVNKVKDYKTNKWVDKITHGTEIVKEIKVREKYVKNLQGR